MKTNNHECKSHPANYVIQAGNNRSLRAREGRWGATGFMKRTARNENEAHPISPVSCKHPRSRTHSGWVKTDRMGRWQTR